MKKAFSIFVLTLLFFTKSYSQDVIYEYHMNYLFNFIRYIQWPGIENQLTFKIIVLDENHPITAELKKSVKDYKVSGRPIEVTELKNLNDITACHILYIPSNRIHVLKKASKMLAGVSVLIVTETNDYVPKHSTINIMVEEDGRMTFTINQKDADERRLEISDRLKKMAK